MNIPFAHVNSNSNYKYPHVAEVPKTRTLISRIYIYIYFCVALVHRISFTFTLYRPQDDDTLVSDQRAETMDYIFSEYPAASFRNLVTSVFITKSGMSTRTKPMKTADTGGTSLFPTK